MSKTFFLFFFLCIHFSFAQQQENKVPAKPKLVVGIIVDQMRDDYIKKYWSKYSENGFKRLVNDGYYCKNTNYNYVPTYTAPGHASVYTGTTPSVHGIVGNNWYSRREKRVMYCAEDRSVKGVGSASPAGQMSPKNMLSPSIADMLRLATNMQGKTIGIALKDRGAILPAGHTANAAYWFEDNTGNWVTSSYYMNVLPEWVNDFNKMGLAEKYIQNDWNTMLPIAQYTESWADDNSYETKFIGEETPVFPHKIPLLSKFNGGLGIIRNTPFGNSFTKDFAIEAIRNEKLGKDENTDFLAISFSSTDNVGHSFGTGSIELEDTYLRLDKDLGELLNFLDKEVGVGNYLLFLTSDHGAVDNMSYLIDKKIPAGTISDSSVADTLTRFLVQKYSDSLFVKYINQQVYLNMEIILDKNLDYDKIQWEVTQILLYVKGIAHVHSFKALIGSPGADKMAQLVRNGYFPRRSGDLAVTLDPNWAEWGKTGTTHGSGYNYDTHVPLLFFGTNIKSGSTMEPVVIPDIAATLAFLLDIPAPSGCNGKVIILK